MENIIFVLVIFWGLVVSLGIGHLITSSVSEYLKYGVWDKTTEPNIPSHNYGVKGSTVGLIERTVFTFFVSMNPGASAVGVFAWISLKLLVTWKWAEDQYGEENRKKKGEAYLEALTGYRLVSLLSNLVSIFSAFLGGIYIYYIQKECAKPQLFGMTIIVALLTIVSVILRKATFPKDETGRYETKTKGGLF